MISSVCPCVSIAQNTPLSAHISIETVTIVPDPSTEGDVVHIYVIIKNNGTNDISAGEPIIISVKIDNEQSAETSLTDVLGLKIDKKRTENLSWTATLGHTALRILHVSVTYSGIQEAFADREIRVDERKTDLRFATPPAVSSTTEIGKPVTISAIIKNIGKNTTQDINISLFADRILKQSYIKKGGLIKGESYEIVFSWTPFKFGIYTINRTYSITCGIDRGLF